MITIEPVIETKTEVPTFIPSDADSAEYVASLDFNMLDDPELLRYVEDTVYSDLVYQFNGLSFNKVLILKESPHGLFREDAFNCDRKMEF